MKKYLEKEKRMVNIQQIKSERSNSSNIDQEPHCNKPINIINKERNQMQQILQLPQLNQSQIKLKKIDQLKNYLKRLKQNFDNQSKQILNPYNIIDNTIKQLLKMKDLLQIQKYEEPWQEIIEIEQDLYINEDNIIKSMTIPHFNEILIQNQLCILELASKTEAIQQQNFWILQIQTFHQTLIYKNQMSNLEQINFLQDRLQA